MGRHRGKLVASTDPEYESRIQAALMGVTNGTYKNITVAARVHKVAWQTLNDRSKGLHMSRRDFSKSRQLLQPSEEEAVKDWLAHESGAARPVHPRDLRAWVNKISGRLPGKHWHRRYLARHKKSISYGGSLVTVRFAIMPHTFFIVRLGVQVELIVSQSSYIQSINCSMSQSNHVHKHKFHCHGVILWQMQIESTVTVRFLFLFTTWLEISDQS
ncbi:hypothetical protein EDB19DRAFT_1912534 [Suillus lakei]|nr:hypothetical protein EDB19DRAFT_1912534 [Suillus lakei]